MAFPRWKSFINVEKDLVGKRISEILAELGFDYTLAGGSPAIMYDRSETSIFDIKSPLEIKIRLVRAVADPVTRFFMGLIGRTFEHSATLIEIYQLGEKNEEQVKNLMSSLIKRLPGDPCDLKNHPMFARAPLLRMRVKKRWRRWLD